MKAFIAIFLIITSTIPTQAITLKVLGKDRQLLGETQIKTQVPTDVGDASILAFEYRHIPYQGSAQGISQIFGIGSELEVISDTEMKAYGWCFSVDGVTPELMPDKVLIENSNSVIEWYYAYAHFQHGTWVGQCVRD